MLPSAFLPANAAIPVASTTIEAIPIASTTTESTMHCGNDARHLQDIFANSNVLTSHILCLNETNIENIHDNQEKK